MASIPPTENAEALIPQFQLERVLNQDQAGRRIILLGSIKAQPALLTLERAPFPNSASDLAGLPTSLASLTNLGANDVYFWYMARAGAGATAHDDLKANLIYPCTPKHIAKYSKQGARMVTETSAIYREHVRPYMHRQRDEGRLNWVWNIIDGDKEAEDVIFRTPLGVDVERGFLLLPDLNWDRRTTEALHLLALVERRDLWSLRDLKVKHVDWLCEMKDKIVQAAVAAYPAVEADQLKLYVHYQPTYYHFHIHVVHVALEAGATQAVGKAIGLDSIISQLRTMSGGDDIGMEQADLSYGLGEASELWTEVFEPLKRRG